WLMRLRPATPDDAEALERIRIRGWQIAYRHVFPPEELDAMGVDSSRWRAWLAAGFEHGQACIVAEDAEGVVGWATFGSARDPDDRYGELQASTSIPTGGGSARAEHCSNALSSSSHNPATRPC